MGLLHYPMVGAGTILMPYLALQDTVADGHVLVFDSQLNVLRSPFIGAVNCGKPFRIMFCLALCPNLHRFVFAFIRINKVKPFVIRNGCATLTAVDRKSTRLNSS